MSETPDQQRARILLANPYLPVSTYDLAVMFGYEPESWDGMYKLPAWDYPILRLSRNWAIAAEVRCYPGTNRSMITKRGRRRIRYVLRKAVTHD